jgi:hypothetical protein
MGLFSRLLKLHSLHPGTTPLEDFFTEIVAHLFSVSRETLFSWIEHLSLLDTSRYTGVHVSTQSGFDPFGHHSIGTRFDILIELSDGSCSDWIAIESKISAREGPDQLKRYAQVLAAEQDIGERILLYITRDYDPKDESSVLQGLESTVCFKQSRWYEFYSFLQSPPRDASTQMLVNEIVKFMEENRMAQSNQFTAVDVLTLSNLHRALNLMNETMGGDVRSKFKDVLGFVPRARPYSHPEWSGYLLIARLDGWECGLGYWWSGNITDYPTVGIYMEVSPNSKSRQEIINAMQKVGQRSGWSSYNLDDSTAWADVVRERSLRDFLSEEDHVAEIRAYFLELLEDLAKIKKKYPHLPWGPVSQQSEEE